MAASIAGVFWQAVSLIRECRGGAVSFGSLEGMFPGRYSAQTVSANGYVEFRIWEVICLIPYVPSVRCPSFRGNSARSPPLDLVVCALESSWSSAALFYAYGRVGSDMM